jgi:Ca2+-binding RTX toxin-like protein
VIRRLLLAVLVLVGSVVLALTAANTVPASSVGQVSQPITANDLKPSACAALNLTRVVAGVNGTAGNDLLLGTGAAETLSGNGGVDCILGGGGNDTINGNGAAAGDVCIGGPGTDTFKKCTTAIQ